MEENSVKHFSSSKTIEDKAFPVVTLTLFKTLQCACNDRNDTSHGICILNNRR